MRMSQEQYDEVVRRMEGHAKRVLAAATSPTPKKKVATEKQFMGQVVAAAKLQGWRVYHVYDSRRSEPGFPDLCLVRGKRLVFAELKTELGKVTHSQSEWLQALDETPAEVYLWRPDMWDHIIETLRREHR